MHQLPAAPPTDPDVRISLIRFLGSVAFLPARKPNGRPTVWRITMLPRKPLSDVVEYPGRWQRESFFELLELFHIYPAFVAPATQPISPCFLCMHEYPFQSLIVAGYSVILIVALKLCAQHPVLINNVHVPVLLAPLPHGLHKANHSLPRRGRIYRFGEALFSTN